MKTLLFIFGTRPEAIKLAPLILHFKENPNFNVHICNTGQHQDLLTPILDFFQIKPDATLNLMQANQNLADFSSRCLNALTPILTQLSPDWVFVQGDTSTAFMGALAAFYNKSKIAHVEAGLRSHDLHNPFPEEANRKFISQLATLHFAPTETAKQNLLNENIPEKNIHVVGNSVVDAIYLCLDKIKQNPEPYKKSLTSQNIDLNNHIILTTLHRRESFGKPFDSICQALQHIAKDFPDTQIVFPLHPNPKVQESMAPLKNIANIVLIPPLNYPDMIYLMKHSSLILTDSGGIQEEAPTLQTPTLVLRNVTERMEGVEAGTAVLVGTKRDNIVEEVRRWIENTRMQADFAGNPYGDGKTCIIVESIIKNVMT